MCGAEPVDEAGGVESQNGVVLGLGDREMENQKSRGTSEARILACQ